MDIAWHTGSREVCDNLKETKVKLTGLWDDLSQEGSSKLASRLAIALGQMITSHSAPILKGR